MQETIEAEVYKLIDCDFILRKLHYEGLRQDSNLNGLHRSQSKWIS